MADMLIEYPWAGRLNKHDLPYDKDIPENLETTFGEIRDVLDSMTNFTIKEKSFFLYMLTIAGSKVKQRRDFGVK